MNQKDVIDILRERPFRPFRLYLTDGATYEIRHPEMMVVGRSTALVFFPPQGMALPAIDHYETIALLHITRLEPLETSAV